MLLPILNLALEKEISIFQKVWKKSNFATKNLREPCILVILEILLLQ